MIAGPEEKFADATKFVAYRVVRGRFPMSRDVATELQSPGRKKVVFAARCRDLWLAYGREIPSNGLRCYES